MLKISPAIDKEMPMQRRDFLKYSAALGVMSALPLWSRSLFAAERPTLPIPPLLSPDAQSRIQLTVQAGKPCSAVNLQPPGLQRLTAWACASAPPSAVTVDIRNTLAEETTVHWHGVEVAGEVDGGPQGVIKPGGSRTVTFTPTQQAATCWFHPHQHGRTGRRWQWGSPGWC